MRHRIIEGYKDIIKGYTIPGGNTEPEILDNVWTSSDTLNKELEKMFKDAVITFEVLAYIKGLDFKIDVDNRIIKIGYEPAYQYDPLFIITLNLNDINNSYYLKVSHSRCDCGYTGRYK